MVIIRQGLRLTIINITKLTNDILDDDECTDGTHNCDPNASCQNIGGGFTCTCNDGYSGDGVTCTGGLICSVNYTCRYATNQHIT